MSEKRPIRLGVAGLGRAFTLMLPTFQRDSRVRLVAACDPRAQARDQFAKDFNACVYSDIESLVRDELVEAIYVASPHQFHASQTLVAAAHGKHVLVEKPMALSLDECDLMISACRDARVSLVVGHCHSFDTPYLRARELIVRGELGRVRMINAMNYTDFLYRPRRPEELRTDLGGGVVYSQAAHQVDVVRMLAGSRVVRVRSSNGNWDPARPTEGAYCAMLWFEDGQFANLVYSGYGHFDSDEWCNWVGEMGIPKTEEGYGSARRRLVASPSSRDEADLKALSTYGGPAYKSATYGDSLLHQHFGPIIVSCEQGDLRPMPDGIWVYGNDRREFRPLPLPAIPRVEVIDELHAAIVQHVPTLHDGDWARETLAVCLALLQSSDGQRDVDVVRSL